MAQFTPNTPDWVKPIILREAARTGVPAILLAAQIQQESGFQPKIYSHAGAAGISQFIPSTARSYGLKVDGQVDERLDPEKAIRAQADLMKDLLTQHDTVEAALSAYNSGKPFAYQDPNFSRGETYNYVKSITGMSGLRGKIKLEPQKEESFLGKFAQAQEATPGARPSYLPAAAQVSLAPQRPSVQSAQKLGTTPSERIQNITKNLTEQVNRPPPTPSTPMEERRQPESGPQPAPQAQEVAEFMKPAFRQPMFGAVKQGIPRMTGSISSARTAFPTRGASPMVQSGGGGYHVVRPGETPGGIAQQHLGNWRRWRELYSGDPRKMAVGTRIKIPTPGMA